MQSTTQSTGVNILITAEVNSGNAQKNSQLNPGLDSKSLNTKEFSEVLDDQKAREKVSASSRLSQAGSKPQNQDSNSQVKPATELVGYTTTFAANNGKGLPLDLPPLEGVLLDVATADGHFVLATTQRTGNGVFTADASLTASASCLPAAMQTAGMAELVAASAEGNELVVDDNDSLQPLQLDAASLEEVESAVVIDSTASEVQLFNAISESAVEYTKDKRNGLQAATGPLPVINPAAPKHTGTQAAEFASFNQPEPGAGMLRQDMANGAVPASTPVAAGVTAMESAVQSGRWAKGQFNQRIDGGEAQAASSNTSTAMTAAELGHAYKSPSQPVLAANAALQPGSAGFSEAVMQRVMWMSSQQINRADIALDPPELGSLQVRVSTQAEHTSVVFSSPHSAVREAVDQGLYRLREMLEQQGLNLADVDVSDQSSNQQQHEEHSAAGQLLTDREDSGHRTDATGQTEPTQTMPQQHVLQLVDQYV